MSNATRLRNHFVLDLGQRSNKSFLPEVALIMAGFVIAGFHWSEIEDLVDPPRKKLVKEQSYPGDNGISGNYYQVRKPTEKEQKAGVDALHRWKNARSNQRGVLADKLVLGRTLIGMTQKEIVSYLGTPDAFSALPDVRPDFEFTGYTITNGESLAELLIELDGDTLPKRATESFLSIDY